MIDDIETWIEQQSEKSGRAVRLLLTQAGRQDLIDELDQRLADIRSGVDGARRCWEAMSPAQRMALKTLDGTRPTLRNLVRRGLIVIEDTGPRITERGLFVLAKGHVG